MLECVHGPTESEGVFNLFAVPQAQIPLGWWLKLVSAQTGSGNLPMRLGDVAPPIAGALASLQCRRAVCASAQFLVGRTGR